MKFLNIFYFFITCMLANIALQAFDSYDVKWEGDVSPYTLELLQSASQLLSLQSSPPATAAGLRNRAEADLQNYLKVLHSQAYYNAKIHLTYDFENSEQTPCVLIKIETGPVYPLAKFKITPSKPSNAPLSTISPEELGIILGYPAYPKDILLAEERLLHLMAKWGYPLASITKREVVADQAIQSIYVTLHVDSGPPARFGPLTIMGNSKVKDEFLLKKISWRKGDPYNPAIVESTQNAIEASGLFRAVSISHAEKVNDDLQLPMQIEVTERKHRSVGWGLKYNTHRGPGLNLEWEHRNINGMGRKLSIDTDLWFDTQDARILYVIPDFLRPAQDLLWIAEVSHERREGYSEASISLGEVIERQVDEHTRVSIGGMYKNLKDTHSDTNNTYNLFKTPMYIRWSNVDNILDPHHGNTINFKIVPSLQFLEPRFAYCISTLTATHYFPLDRNECWVLATRAVVGSIFGSPRRTIPASERFYEGSENVLRGYQFQTVSPLNHDHKPIGGRSMMIYTAELRAKATENFGWAFFYDVGNVYKDTIPNFNHKLLQSVGFGLRYHTAVGPLRLDFAVPLNRRPHVDNRFQIYLGIGQSF